MQFKSVLRNEYKKRRRAMSQADYEAASLAITQNLAGLPELNTARLVLSYVAVNREADTRPTLANLVERGVIVCTPGSIDPERALNCFHFVTPDDPLLDRAWAPGYVAAEVCDAISLGDVDVFLVPGLVWDSEGYRVGFGGGYFDRLLVHAHPGALTVGVAYEWQLMEKQVPRDPWDMPVRCVVTDHRVLRIPGS